MKLQLVHNEDKIVIMAVDKQHNWVFKLRERASIFAMAIRDDALVINLDAIKKMPFCLMIPQFVLHEFLHLLTRYSFHAGKVIHKVHSKTRGMLL